jgi:voltage-gated sodium channel
MPAHVMKHSKSLKEEYFDTVQVIVNTYTDRLLHNAHDWHPMRHLLHRVLNTRVFELWLTCVITFQFFIAIREVNHQSLGEDVPGWMDVCNHLCLAFYCIELVVRFFIYRKDFFQSKFHLLDIAVVVLDIAVASSTLILGVGEGSGSTFSVLRMLRFLRVARFGRLLRFFPEVFILVHSLGGSLRVIFWAGLMVLIMTTMWSMVAVEFIQPMNKKIASEGCLHVFETVYQANLTFLQIIVAGDNFGECTMPLMREYPWTAVYFCCVLGTVGFMLLNLVLSAIVDRASQVRSENDHILKLAKIHFYEAAKRCIQKVCLHLDTQGDGYLSLDAILKEYDENNEFAAAFHTLGLSKSNLSQIFYTFDDQKMGVVKHQEFAEHLLKMRTVDEHTTIIAIKSFLNDLQHALQAEFKKLDRHQTREEHARQEEQEELRNLSQKVTEIQSFNWGCAIVA